MFCWLKNAPNTELLFEKNQTPEKDIEQMPQIRSVTINITPRHWLHHLELRYIVRYLFNIRNMFF
jgi:hypothetical protein